MQDEGFDTKFKRVLILGVVVAFVVLHRAFMIIVSAYNSEFWELPQPLMILDPWVFVVMYFLSKVGLDTWAFKPYLVVSIIIDVAIISFVYWLLYRRKAQERHR
jgi:hypothetical protein